LATLLKMAAKEPNSPISPPHEFDSSPVPSDVTESSAGALVQCDNVGSCPDGTTCCLHRYGYKLDLRFPPQGRCCLDGNHCCPSGFDCDFSFSKCDVPLTGLLPASNDTPQPGVIHCDTKFYCPPGNSCCKRPTGQWGCCSYPLECKCV
uniref:Granulins domain-containing protein n=1 Tax=Esox lucius TaxID=8010 RepID=A0A6Q2XIQ6_ESOLU